MHFHGCPVSGHADQAGRFYARRHVMVSFAYPKHMEIVAESAKTFVLDNGAFSAWTKGKKLNVKGYYKWVDQWKHHPGFQWALIPDVIDGEERENDRLIFDQSTGWPGYLKDHGVPVWHLHESLDRFRRLCGAFKTVALGSSGKYRTPGNWDWWERMREVFSAVTGPGDAPAVRLHGLRMLDPEIFSKIPLVSADSTNAAQNAGLLKRFGMYAPDRAWARANVIADRIEAFNSHPVWNPKLAKHNTMMIAGDWPGGFDSDE